ncbi:MAG TPA: FtsX-like permease family protein [Gammaproteobacteria bacterium]|nr:FtsX-like permease family protein [Gammaproteobacteria bacterium]
MTTFHVSIFRDVLLQAISSLKENKLRTVLSVMGITIGICAVMVVGTVSQGVKKYIYKELDTYGLETLWVYRKWEDENPFRSVREGSGIDNEDLKYMHSCCPSVKQVTPVVYSDADSVPMRSKGTFVNTNLEGVGVNYLDINNDQLILGRGFRLEDIQRRKPVAIIGSKIRDELFGAHTNPIKKILRWGEVRLTVIGVLEYKDRNILSQLGADNYDVNKRVLIPYTLYQQQLGTKDVHTLQAEAASVKDTRKALGELTDLLKRRHNYHYEYVTESMDTWIETAEDLLRKISLVGLVAALISLLVGGMGIMNIMSTSVVERTREIGIRKALGAYRRDILLQFLLEATVVSVIGGLLGMILGIFAGFGISYFSGYDLGVSWSTAFVAVLVSIVVGVLSGYYPAYRAASLKPVDALRYE